MLQSRPTPHPTRRPADHRRPLPRRPRRCWHPFARTTVTPQEELAVRRLQSRHILSHPQGMGPTGPRARHPTGARPVGGGARCRATFSSRAAWRRTVRSKLVAPSERRRALAGWGGPPGRWRADATRTLGAGGPIHTHGHSNGLRGTPHRSRRACCDRLKTGLAERSEPLVPWVDDVDERGQGDLESKLHRVLAQAVR